VPREHSAGHAGHRRFVEDALRVFRDVGRRLFVVVADADGEKSVGGIRFKSPTTITCRRAPKSADRIRRFHWRRFVEDDGVELFAVDGEEMADRQRTHQEAWS
jgi:hypothetical protein